MRSHFLHWRSLGCRFKSRWGYFQFCFLREFSEQILLKIDWFCIDLIGVFIIFLTEIMICSFNNNMLEKANGKAFNITASAQLFTTESTPGSFRASFVHFSKVASLQQVNSPNSSTLAQGKRSCVALYQPLFTSAKLHSNVSKWQITILLTEESAITRQEGGIAASKVV